MVGEPHRCWRFRFRPLAVAPKVAPAVFACELGSRGLRNISKPDCLARVPDAIADTPAQAANLRARAELMKQIAVIVKDSGLDASRSGRPVRRGAASYERLAAQPRFAFLDRCVGQRRDLRSAGRRISTCKRPKKAAFGAIQLGASLPTGSDRPTPSRSLFSAQELPKVETICHAATKVTGRTGRALDFLRLCETLRPVLRCSFAHRRAATRCCHAHAVAKIKGRATGSARYDSGRVD